MTGKQRAVLRKMANTLDTIIFIGKEGITDPVVKEVYDALEARELIKGCVQQGSDLDARTALTVLCEKTGAAPVQCIGRKFCMYRPKQQSDPVIELPR